MDILITDDSGNVPFVKQRIAQKDEWIILNAPSAGVPMEAMDYRSRRPDRHRATGPTGVFLEMEWGLDMDWYDHDACWRPYIPLKTDTVEGGPLSATGCDWFFDFDMTTPYNHLSTGVFIVPELTRKQIHADILNWSWCVDDICSNHPFPPDTAKPPDFDHGTLVQGFTSLEELQTVACVCKRTAVDMLGFITWWTSSVSRWDANLDHHVVAIIQNLQLHRFLKRGVLVDLEHHWQEINIPSLLQHRVPIAYPWSPTLASTPRFTGLSPRLLLAYDQARHAAAQEVLSSDLPDLSSDFALVKCFDHYFQELHVGGHPDPDVEFDDDWLYFIMDFQGWSCRQIPLRVARHYYLLFGSSVSMEGQANVVLFRRWEPLDNFLVGQPLSPATMEDIEEGSVVRETGEIRELHKHKHAPVDGLHFDLEGRPQYSTCPPDGPDRTDRGGLQRMANISSRQWLHQMADDRRLSRGRAHAGP